MGNTFQEKSVNGCIENGVSWQSRLLGSYSGENRVDVIKSSWFCIKLFIHYKVYAKKSDKNFIKVRIIGRADVYNLSVQSQWV